MNTCFRIIQGQDSFSDYLFQLEGWELAAGVIFWWTFVTIVVYVVMNLLIAIVVDAYTSVKVRGAPFPSLFVFFFLLLGEKRRG